MINIQDTKANSYGNNQYQTYRYITNMDFTVRTDEIEKLQSALTSSLELVSKESQLDSKDKIGSLLNTSSQDLMTLNCL